MIEDSNKQSNKLKIASMENYKRNAIDYKGELLNIENSIRKLVQRAQHKANIIDMRILKRINP